MVGISLIIFFSLLFSSFLTGVICGGGGEITCLDAGGGNTPDDNFGDEGGLMDPRKLYLIKQSHVNKKHEPKRKQQQQQNKNKQKSQENSESPINKLNGQNKIFGGEVNRLG